MPFDRPFLSRNASAELNGGMLEKAKEAKMDKYLIEYYIYSVMFKISSFYEARTSKKQTICHVLLSIGQKTNDPEIRRKLGIALAMAKKMDNRLKYYKRKEDKNE